MRQIIARWKLNSARTLPVDTTRQSRVPPPIMTIHETIRARIQDALYDMLRTRRSTWW